MPQTLDPFIDRKVVILKDSEPVLTAAMAMCESQVGCVITINDEKQVSGILTDRDIVCNLISQELDSNLPIKQIMETDITSLDELASLDEAIELMKEKGIRRLPIMNRSSNGTSKCVGIVTLDDFIAGEFLSPKDLSDIVKSQIIRRKKFSRQNSSKNETHLDQTYNKFISKIKNAIDLDKAVTEEVTKFFLSCLIQRLHYSGGVQLISQLPKRLHENLLDLPAGPNRKINDKTIAQGISIRTGKPLDLSRKIAREVWTAICNHLGPGETDHVMHQLPNSLKELLEISKSNELDDRNVG